MSFTWQNGRQLSTAQKSGLSLSYTYNASGIRTEKTVNGVTTEYYLDGSSIVAEKTGTDVIWYLYDGMGLAGFELNGTSYYYVYNGQGDVIGILDSSGNRVVTYTYDAWGSPLSVTGSLASPVGQRILHADEVWRELRFSLLAGAETVFDAPAGEEVLLQGVADCCIREGDALTVVDYKTDYVTAETLAARASEYAPQVRAYAAALTRLLGKPVREGVLFFLRTGESVSIDCRAKK